MNRHFLSMIVIAMTVVSCTAIAMLKVQLTGEELPLQPIPIKNSCSNIATNQDTQAGDKDIADNKQESSPLLSHEKGSIKDVEDAERNYKDNSHKDDDTYVRYTYEGTTSSSTYESVASSATYESAIQEAKSMLTLKETVYLIGVARYLDVKDFSLIQHYVVNGATQEQLDSLWDGIRSKVPEKDYSKMYAIFLKYKR